MILAEEIGDGELKLTFARLILPERITYRTSVVIIRRLSAMAGERRLSCLFNDPCD
jgi:hypothetical protein